MTLPSRQILAICWALVLTATTLPALLWLGEENPVWIKWGIRITALVSLILLFNVFIARPARILWPARALPQFLMRYRRRFGLMLACSHTIHLGYVVQWFSLPGVPAPTLTLNTVLAGLGILLLWAMAATSNAASIRRLGKYWSWLHKGGLYLLFILFFVTYLPLALEGMVTGWLGVALLSLALWIRLRAL